MNIEAVRAFFLWCTIINGGLLIFAFLVTAFAREWIYRMHSLWFPISKEAFVLVLYCSIGLMKVFVLMFNLVPYIALSIIG